MRKSTILAESLLPALMYLTSWYRHIRFSSELSNFCFLWRVRLRRHRQIGMHPNLGKPGHKNNKNEILSTRRPMLLSCSRFHWKHANYEGKSDMTGHDMTWQGMSWHDMTWLMTCHFMSWHDPWHGMTWQGMSWHDITWHVTCHIMTWQGMSWHPRPGINN